MRVLVVDSDLRVQDALSTVFQKRNDVEDFEFSDNASDALRKVERSKHEILLLDIAMPDLCGDDFLERVEELVEPLPALVFVTANTEHALAAFERHAVDYVLKPFSEERITAALDVAFQRAASDRAARLTTRPSPPRVFSDQHSPRVAIKTKGKISFIDPATVPVVQAEGNYVMMHSETGSYLLRQSISEMAEILKDYGFIRIHRSALVNSRFVEEIQPLPTGEYELRIKGGRPYTVSRTYKKNLKALAQFWIGTEMFAD
jgi:two-component system LytT family response regulator